MQVFHYDPRTRAFLGASEPARLPLSPRRRAAEKGFGTGAGKQARATAPRWALPAASVINPPPHDAPAGSAWRVRKVDRSDPARPRALWHLQALDHAQAEPDAEQTLPGASAVATTSAAIEADEIALTALVLLLARGRARPAAKRRAETLLRRWITARGGDGQGRLQAELASLLDGLGVGEGLVAHG